MNPIPDQPTTVYAPFFEESMTLVTCWAANGESILKQRATAHLVLSVLEKLQREKSFDLTAYVILPDHVHLLLRSTPGKAMSPVVELFLQRYQRDYAQLMGIPGSLEVWDRRRALERVSDVAAFATALDRIHYDPIQHGHVSRPETWAFSSYARWVERGLYKLGWGWRKPMRLQGG